MLFIEHFFSLYGLVVMFVRRQTRKSLFIRPIHMSVSSFDRALLMRGANPFLVQLPALLVPYS